MATNDHYRVTKDTSARKNTGNQSSMHSAVEAAASRAAHDAYVKGLISGYEEQLHAMEAEHADQIAEIQTKNNAAIQEIKEQQQRVVDAAVVDLRREKQNLQSTLDEALAANKTANQTAQSQRESYQINIDDLAKTHENELGALRVHVDDLKKGHANEIAALKRQVRFEIHFKCHNRKTRTYIHRPTARFFDATNELWRETFNSSSRYLQREALRFTHNGFLIGDQTLTLEAVRPISIETVVCKSRR